MVDESKMVEMIVLRSIDLVCYCSFSIRLLLADCLLFMVHAVTL